MVGQHDAARTHAYRLRTASDMAHQHGCGRTGYTRHIVVLGQPVALESQPFGMLGGVQRNSQCVGHSAAFPDGDQVEHGEGNVLKWFHAVDCEKLGWNVCGWGLAKYAAEADDSPECGRLTGNSGRAITVIGSKAISGHVIGFPECVTSCRFDVDDGRFICRRDSHDPL